METTAALTNNTFKIATTTHAKLNGVDGQLVQLRSDYEEMKKMREQSKQALQAKFDEVYGKIQQTKEYIVQEGVKTNATLVEFQSKFESNIKKLEERLANQQAQFENSTDSTLSSLSKRIEKLDNGIEQEKQDRVRTEQEHLQDIQHQLNSLFSKFENEKLTRVENEKLNLLKIKDESARIASCISNEQGERITKLGDLEKHTKYELESAHRFLEGFKGKTIEEFGYQIGHVQNEMDNRFEHQNQLVDDLRGVIKTIQETLKIMGKEV